MSDRAVIRALVHRGFVRASGLSLSASILGEEDMRRRILSLWEPGCRVYRTAEGYVLRFPSHRLLDSRCCLGAPLVEHNGRLWAAPIAPLEDQTAGAAAVMVIAGSIREELLSDSQSVDPSGWLDLSEWRVADIAPLGMPPVTAEAEPEKPAFEAREKLAGLPEASEELKEAISFFSQNRIAEGPHGDYRMHMGRVVDWIMTALAHFTALFERPRPNSQVRPDPFANAPEGPYLKAGHSWLTKAILILLLPITLVVTVVVLVVMNILDSIVGIRRIRGTGGYAPPAGGVGGLFGQSGSPRKSFLQSQWLAKLLMRTRLARLIGRKHAGYLMRVMEMFERGEVTEALKYAIPLGGGEGDAAPALRMPGPRSDFSINPNRQGGTAAMLGELGLLVDLRAQYRKAFAKLDEEGQIDKAAFVLAELLWDSEEAVAYLERHGKLRLAAELAEARELAPGLVVRQWFVAGDRHRAILIARRTGAFADAVLRLEKANNPLAMDLRRIWAVSLAEAGDYSGAVEVVWDYPEERSEALVWLEICVRSGGIAGARMLPRKLEADPSSFPTVRDKALEILQDDDPASVEARQALAQGIRQAPVSPQISTLARATVRALIRDAGKGLTQLGPSERRHLLKIADDGSLRSDIPALPDVVKHALEDRPEPVRLTIEPNDAGTIPIADAVPVLNGRCLIALGEAGLLLVNRSGRTITHWDHPVHRIVISDHGNRAIGIAPRGSWGHLSKIDLFAQTVEPWCDLELGRFADTYEGSIWFTASGKHFLALDATAPNARSIWRRANIGPEVVDVRRSPSSLALITKEIVDKDAWGNPTVPHFKWMAWNYSLPGMVLNRQIEIPVHWDDVAPPLAIVRAISWDGTVINLAAMVSPDVPESLNWTLSNDMWGTTEIPIDGIQPNRQLDLIHAGDWISVVRSNASGVQVDLVHHYCKRVCAYVKLSGAATGFQRILGNKLWIGDDRGRLLAIDLSSGEIALNRRIS